MTLILRIITPEKHIYLADGRITTGSIIESDKTEKLILTESRLVGFYGAVSKNFALKSNIYQDTKSKNPTSIEDFIQSWHTSNEIPIDKPTGALFSDLTNGSLLAKSITYSNKSIINHAIINEISKTRIQAVYKEYCRFSNYINKLISFISDTKNDFNFSLDHNHSYTRSLPEKLNNDILMLLLFSVYCQTNTILNADLANQLTQSEWTSIGHRYYSLFAYENGAQRQEDLTIGSFGQCEMVSIT